MIMKVKNNDGFTRVFKIRRWSSGIFGYVYATCQHCEHKYEMPKHFSTKDIREHIKNHSCPNCMDVMTRSAKASDIISRLTAEMQAQAEEIERLKRWNQSLRDNEEARVKEIRVIVRQLKEEACDRLDAQQQEIERLKAGCTEK